MASRGYKLKYYKDIPHNGENSYRLEIYSTYNPTIQPFDEQEIGAVLQGLVLEVQGQQDEIDSPIVKTSLSMTFVDAYDVEDGRKNGFWEEFYTPDALFWKVVLVCNPDGTNPYPIWTGFVTPDSYSEVLSYRGSVTITARDNIGHLQDFPFDAEGDAEGMISMRELVEAAWAKTDKPMTLEWAGSGRSRWMVTEQYTSAPDTLMNVSAFEGKNWYEVLESVLYAYGAVLRYRGDNTFHICPLRWLPEMNSSSLEYVPHITPVFEVGATREFVPAAKAVEEVAEYDLPDAVAMQEVEGFTGASNNYTSDFFVWADGELSQMYTTTSPVHPIANVNGKGWGNVASSTLFFDASKYEIGEHTQEKGKEAEVRSHMYIAANNTASEFRSVYYTMTSNCEDMKFKMQFGNPIGLDSSNKIEQLVGANLFAVTYAVSFEQNGVTKYYEGDGKWDTAYKELVKTFDPANAATEFECDVILNEFIGVGTLRFIIVQVNYVRMFGGVYARKGVYAALKEFSVSTTDTQSLRSGSRVNTIYNEKNNVVIARDPKLAPAYDEVSVPALIKNGIFERIGDVVKPTRNWIVDIIGENEIVNEMAVGVHLQLLAYYAKPNNLISGTIVNADLATRYVFDWGGSEHLLLSGSYDFLTGRIEGAVLREFARYRDIWGDMTTLPVLADDAAPATYSLRERGLTNEEQAAQYEAALDRMVTNKVLRK